MIETVWVSFADRKKFRGIAIVDVDLGTAENKKAAFLAVAKTIEMKCNAGPDTEVLMTRFRRFIDCEYKNKLILDKALIEKIDEELAQKRRPH
jgi:hypothetical protein